MKDIPTLPLEKAGRLLMIGEELIDKFKNASGTLESLVSVQ